MLFNTSTGIEDPKSTGFVYASGNNINIDGLNGSAQVYDISGKLVALKEIQSGEINIISLSAEANGIYLVKVIDGKSVSSHKVMVN